MPEQDKHHDQPDDEEHEERVNRELLELLNELRVALPGVQVLFAFLLILPFQQGFQETSGVDRLIYFVALLASAVAGALLIAPSVYHRLNFRRGNKERMLTDSNVLLITGTAFTGLGIACSIYLIADVLFGGLVAVLTTLATVVVYVSAWAALPLIRRRDPDT